MTSTDAVAGASACLSIVALCGSLIFIPMLLQRTANVHDELLAGSDEFKTLADDTWARLREVRRLMQSNGGILDRSARSLSGVIPKYAKKVRDSPVDELSREKKSSRETKSSGETESSKKTERQYASAGTTSQVLIPSGSSVCQCNEQNFCPPGPAGQPGLSGQDGDSGNPGLPGQKGAAWTGRSEHKIGSELPCVKCPAGPKGASGEAGPPGTQGSKGKPGVNGSPGKDGPSGPQGPLGSNGESGQIGKDGLAGNPGKDASSHAKGERGDKGEVGPEGPVGSLGPHGSLGKSGAQGGPGMPGTAGKDGWNGPQGAKGQPGRVGDPGKDALYCSCPKRRAFSAKS